MTITTLINTRDEAEHIRRSVESATPLGQVFVVDSGSSDATAAIATAAGATVVRHDWSGYAAQKNWARETLPIKTEWILHLDADEFLTPILRAEIGAAIRAEGCDGYYLPRQNIFQGRLLKHAWWYPDYQLRLFKRQRGRYEDRSVHEHVIVEGEVGFLEHPLMHENLKGIDAFLDRHVRYAALEAKEMDAPPNADREIRAGSLVGSWPERRRALKRLLWSRLPSRAAARYVWMLLIRRGYRDGRQGHVYSELIASYEAMIDAKRLEAATSSIPPAGPAAGLTEPLSLLVCPSCKGGLGWGTAEAVCTACARRYPVFEGIPDFTGSSDEAGDLDSSTRQKRAQAAYFDDAEGEPEFEIRRPHGTPRFHRWLLKEKFDRSVAGIEELLPGGTTVVSCGGSGMDAEFLVRAGAVVICTDISLGACLRAKARAERFGLPLTPVVADAEQLPLADRSVDVAYVHDGLHHLERPAAGLAELARIAKRAVSVTEPAQAAITKVAVRAGLALEREEAGNEVARVRPAEIAQALTADGLEVVEAKRYAMYYAHAPGRPMKAFSSRALFPLAKVAFRAGNTVAGRLGNKATVRAIRSDLPMSTQP